MTLKQARSEVRSQIKYNYKSRYINFTKEFKYYISDYLIATTVYRCYGDGRLVVVNSNYAKQFIKKKKEYECKRSKRHKYERK